MVTKSIIDRILILAAVVCAAGLAWQLTVLLTSKAQVPAVHKADAVVQPPPTPVASAVPDAPNAPSVRVVYPPEQGLQAPKTTAKASDGPVTAKLPAAPVPPAASAAVPSAALQPQAAPFVVPSAVATAPVLPASPAPQAPVATASAAPAGSSASTPVADPAPAAASDSAAATPPANDAAATAPSAPTAPSSTEVRPQPAGWSPEPADASADQTASAASPSVPAARSDAVSPAIVPAPESLASLGATPRTAAASAPPAKHVSGSGININNASVDALDHLRGGGHIGQAIARHRPYRSIEDLVKKRVLRRDTYEQIKHQIATQ